MKKNIKIIITVFISGIIAMTSFIIGLLLGMLIEEMALGLTRYTFEQVVEYPIIEMFHWIFVLALGVMSAIGADRIVTKRIAKAILK